MKVYHFIEKEIKVEENVEELIGLLVDKIYVSTKTFDFTKFLFFE